MLLLLEAEAGAEEGELFLLVKVVERISKRKSINFVQKRSQIINEMTHTFGGVM